MNMAKELITFLEGEIAKRDAELCERTEEVEHALADLNNALAELAAIKAQGVVMPEQVLSNETLWDIRNHVACNEVLQSDDSLTICVKHGRAIEAAVLARLTAAPAAPAADALYEALRQITREYIRTCVQLNGDKEEEMQDVTCVKAANKALAAHRAKGVKP